MSTGTTPTDPRERSELPAGTLVESRDGALTGKTTGVTLRCRLESCNGLRYSVKWPDGKTTFPCGRGLAPSPTSASTWRIQ